MNETERPTLDLRNAGSILEDLLQRGPAYLPGWLPAEGSGAAALIRAYARMMQVVIDRLNLAPEKNKLAFLDMLGINLIPARGARAPVVFTPLPDGRAVQVPAGSRLGANAGGGRSPLYFETETPVTVVPARLTALYSLAPDQDGYAAHDLTAGQPATLFEPLQPVPHELYMAHDRLFAFDGKATLEIELTLARAPGNPQPKPLSIAWEYWDGEAWTGFSPFNSSFGASSHDGTAGFSHSGTVTLRADCGRSEKLKVKGIDAYWVRARVDGGLAGAAMPALPQIERVRLRGTIERTRDQSTPPDQALAEGRRIDLTRAFTPLGHAPRPGSVFYLAAEEAFSRPGTEVTLHFTRVLTVEEDADEQTSAFETIVRPENARLVAALQGGASAVITAILDVDSSLDAETDQIGEASEALSTDDPSELPEKIRTLLESVKRARLVASGGPTLESAYREFYNLSAAAWSLITMSQPESFAPPELAWEYWNGDSWQSLDVANPDLPAWRFLESSPSGEPLCEFVVPGDVAQVTYSGRQAYWIRARLAKGGYSRLRLTTYRDRETNLVNLNPVLENRPPLLEGLAYDFIYRSPWEPPERCFSYNNFRFRQHSQAAGQSPEPFAPYIPIDEQTAALYLGFDRPLPNSQVSLYLDLEERDAAMPPLVWEAWNGESWRELVVTDGTEHLRLPGILAFIAPSWKEGRPLLSRFGQTGAWLRARLKTPGAPPKARLRALYANAVWAAQVQTVQNELLGSGSGQPGQVLFFRNTPVLPGEEIEVRELEGPRAEVEYPILRDALINAGLPESHVRPELDRRTGRVRAVWVRWEYRAQLHFSGPDDRHYTVERAQGRLIFNPRRAVPPGANNVRAVRYQAGGGQTGNVPAKSITQVLSAATVQGVTNSRAAEGGAEGETVPRVLEREPEVIRHRSRSVSARDFEALAYEASPGIALARALPITAPGGRIAPGWVTVIIVPNAADAQPQPSYELRVQVRDYLAARGPATVPPRRITVAGPVYLLIGLAVRVVPREAGDAGQVERRVRAAVEGLFHPVRGGPDGRGWSFGRDVYLSDIAAVVESVAGVDHAEGLDLLLHGSPAGERIEVPPDRIVAAGEIRIEMSAAC